LAKFSGATISNEGWTVYNTSNSGLPNNYILNSIVIDKNGNKWIGTKAGLAKFEGISLGSAGWTVYNSGSTGLPNDNVKHIAISTNNTLWIGTDDGLARFDGANGWNVFKPSNPISSTGMPHNNVMCIDFDANADVWIGTSGGLVKYNGSLMTTYKTTNSQIPSNSITAIAIENNGNIWLGTDQYGLVKYDGVNWITFNKSNSSLPHNQINFIRIDGSGTKWIGTYAGLALFNEDGIVSVKENSDLLPTNYELMQNFPNPFNPSTRIDYQVPNSGNVTLKVYDILGNEISTIVNEFKQAGNYSVEFGTDNSKLSSGVYFYTLRTGNYFQTKKMIYLK